MNEHDANQAKGILLGRITGVHGIKGWVKIHSYTDPREAIFDYEPWFVGKMAKIVKVLESNSSGRYLLAKLQGVTSREEAEAMAGQDIAVERSALPPLDESEFYWTDLVGLAVVNRDGTPLGTIQEMLATGANDVMVVRGERERLIPFVMDRYVSQVDLEQGTVTVDWDPEF